MRKSVSASFSVMRERVVLPDNYALLLSEIKARIREQRIRTVLAANSTTILLYWDVGAMILEQQGEVGWGARVIDRLSTDLRTTYPEMRGFSPRNLKYMRAFAAAWADRQIVQRVVAQLPWRHNIALLEKVDTQTSRLWYARQAVKVGWSYAMLLTQIQTQAQQRHGKALNNFEATLSREHSDLAADVFKDPYVFDFIGTADVRRERELEVALVDHIQRFLLELGTGFAFVGRQVHLQIGTEDFFVDLLFYHLKLRCYVVVELKVVPFDPGFVGQLNMYLSAADDLLRHEDDKPSIGLLLCRSKNKIVVEYALRNLKRPIGVAKWETKLVEQLPKDMQGSLPSIEEIEKRLNSADDADL